jgi:phage tail-like protein
LLDYLPDIYRDQEHPFLNQYLSAFEKILIGRNDSIKIPAEEEGSSSTSLEETIASIAKLFDPIVTPEDFLPWLASWAALSLRADLDEGQQREFIANIIQLYRRRGTKDNLAGLLKIFTKTTPQIYEDVAPSQNFQQRHTYSGPASSPPHFFKVLIFLGAAPDPETVDRQREIAQSLIETEKPAYTFYELEIQFPSMQIGTYADVNKFHATLGVDTLINTYIPPTTIE